MACTTTQISSTPYTATIDGENYEIYNVEVNSDVDGALNPVWRGEAVYYQSKNYLINSTDNPFPDAYCSKGRELKIASSQGNTAIIADPGFHFTFDFSEWESELPRIIGKIKVRIGIGLFNEDGHIPLQSEMEYTMDGNGMELDLSEPLRIVLPFIDVNWAKEEHFKKDLRYKIDITCNDNAKSFRKHLTGKMITEDKHEGPFVNGYIKEKMPRGKPWRHRDGALTLEEIIYTEDGAWFNIGYPGDRPTATYLVGENGASSNFAPFPNTRKETKVDHFEACYLPYPRVKNGRKPLSDCYIWVTYLGMEYKFFPPNNRIYKGFFMIIGSEKPRSIGNEKQGEVAPSPDSVKKEPEEKTGFFAKIINWFKSIGK